MPKSLNVWGQTKHWEEACVNTRRSLAQRERRLKLFHIKKTDRVLDLGCGDGLNIKILRQKGVNRVVGVDISKVLLGEAKRLNPKAKFYLASAEKLPFKGNSFEIVLVDSVFHHLMAFKPCLKEIKRVLALGGRLCFIEPHKSILRELYDFVSELPLAKYVPVLKERSVSYLGEKKFMKHWLRNENRFYKILKDLDFKEIVKKKDILSIIGTYEKPRS